jgi:hypothetical protein
MRILAAIGALAVIVAVSAAVFVFGGFYSVAGTAEDPGVVHWAAGPGSHGFDRPPCRRPTAGQL